MSATIDGGGLASNDDAVAADENKFSKAAYLSMSDDNNVTPHDKDAVAVVEDKVDSSYSVTSNSDLATEIKDTVSDCLSKVSEADGILNENEAMNEGNVLARGTLNNQQDLSEVKHSDNVSGFLSNKGQDMHATYRIASTERSDSQDPAVLPSLASGEIDIVNAGGHVPTELSHNQQGSTAAAVPPNNAETADVLLPKNTGITGATSSRATTENEDVCRPKNEREDRKGGSKQMEEVSANSEYVRNSKVVSDWNPRASKTPIPPKPAEEAPMWSERPPWRKNDNFRNDVIQTEAGEKARETPYINEIKKRKFQREAKNKLFVGGLVFEATKDFLYEQFEKYGEIEDACIVTDRNTGQSRGFGYVTFVHREDGTEAIKAIDGLRINGKTLCVEFADDPKGGPPRRRPPPPERYSYDNYPPSRGRDYPRSRGRGYDMERYPPRDPYYDRDPDSYYRHPRADPYYDRPPYDRPYRRDYEGPPSREYSRLPPREYDRLAARDYDYPPSRDYERPPPRWQRPPSRDYDHNPALSRRSPPPKAYYDDYRKTLPRAYAYDDRPMPPTPQATIREVDRARLRVNRERIRHEKFTSADYARLSSRRNSSHRVHESPSSSSESSDDERSKSKKSRKTSAFPSAYLS